ncbi:hypothetical protein CGCF415_v015673 [Colletotrichum fructicola]|nr:hypothetical protein CGCF415_v015673 [Colletotrichum fructicola]KAF4920712.1 hypothetical protein CGCF245_v015694 [Colletotrichum fructicola]KAF5488155.1 hypothetical protein CGCF413_v012388 [Colletotrichum fructicola]
MKHPEDAEEVDTMSSIAIRWNATMPMTRDIITGQAEPLPAEESTPFEYFTAVDPRLSDPDEREELIRVMDIEEVVTPKKKKGKVDMSNHFTELEVFDANRPRITESFQKTRKDE